MLKLIIRGLEEILNVGRQLLAQQNFTEGWCMAKKGHLPVDIGIK